MFTIEMLPAEHGDALWIEYGDNNDPSRILIDCGLKGTYRNIKSWLMDNPDWKFELLILTHVDTDHIGGAIPLLMDAEISPDRFGDVWFNGWHHVESAAKEPAPDDGLGAKHGEMFAAVLKDRNHSWNVAFGGDPIMIPDTGDLPCVELPGGMKLTLLSPTREKMKNLKTYWLKNLRKELPPGDAEAALAMLDDMPLYQPDALGGKPKVDQLIKREFEEDPSDPNGSSIAVLAEFEGKSVLLAGDAHASVLHSSLGRLVVQKKAEGYNKDNIPVDAFKVSHHGSVHNTSLELLKVAPSDAYLISTNGNQFHHPEPTAVARIVGDKKRKKKIGLYFNYKSEENRVWNNAQLKKDYKFTTTYPSGEEEGLILEI